LQLQVVCQISHSKMSRYRVILLLLCLRQQALSIRSESEKGEEEEAYRSFNPWNEFQHYYKGCYLYPSQFPALYRWSRRAEMESVSQHPCEIVEIFLEEFRPKEDQSASAVDIQQYAQMLPLPKDVRAEDLSDAVGSPYAIARTLYGMLITHIPRADISSEWQEDGHRPIAEFLSKFRVGDKEHPGVESRIREWIEELHELTGMYFDARHEGKGVQSWLKKKMVNKLRLNSKNKEAVKEGLKDWVDEVIHDLHLLAGSSGVEAESEGELVTHWSAEVNALYDQLGTSYSNGALDEQRLSSPANINKTSNGDNWRDVLTMVFNHANYKPKTKTEQQQLHFLADAYEHDFISDEHDFTLATIDDLRVCFVELLHKLEWVRDNFHLWKQAALQGHTGPLQEATFEWARNSWDSLGLVIPGNESPESKRFGSLSGTLLLEKLESLDSAAPGFVLDSATISVQRMLLFNVAKFLSGEPLLIFVQMAADAGPSLKLVINAREIPSLVPSSAKTFTFEQISDMSLYQPGFEAATNLSTDLTATGTWYVKNIRLGMLGSIKAFLERIAEGKVELSNPSAAAVLDINGKVIAEPAFVEKTTVEALVRLALGSSE